MQCNLEYTTLRKLTRATEIWYDPDPQNTVIPEDRDFVKAHLLLPDEDFNSDRISPWSVSSQIVIFFSFSESH